MVASKHMEPLIYVVRDTYKCIVGGYAFREAIKIGELYWSMPASENDHFSCENDTCPTLHFQEKRRDYLEDIAKARK